jgi:hypothetical protein
VHSLCLAEAQQIAVQKALAKGASDSLMAKLVFDVAQKYNNVRPDLIPARSQRRVSAC